MSNLEKSLLAFEEKNYQETLTLLKPLAEEGNPESQCILGNIYHLGLGINPHIKAAIAYFLKDD